MYESGKYCALDVAEYVLKYCHEKGIKVTHLQLQKILYFLNGEWIRKKSDFLIDDDFYAWQMGPVIRKVYNHYAVNGGLSINPDNEYQYEHELSDEDKTELNPFIEKYAKMTAWVLVDMSHQTDPWINTTELFGNKSRISKNSIRKYFSGNLFDKLSREYNSGGS